MIRRTLSGVVAIGSAFFFVLPVAAQPKPTVREDADANGYHVRVSFNREPEAFARAAHSWTLDRAKRVAEQIRRDYPATDGDNAIAKLHIEGKPGDGNIRTDKGPHPTLPDWPLVEQNFRVRNRNKAEDIDNRLRDIGDLYQKAKRPTEEFLRKRQKPAPTAEKDLGDSYTKYNAKVDELVRDVYKGAPQSLPRLTLRDLKEYADEWDDAKKDQYLVETMEAAARKRKEELTKVTEEIEFEKKRIDTDRTNGDNLDTLPQREKELKAKQEQVDRDQKSLKEDEKALDQLAKAAESRLDGLQNGLADSSRVLPTADAFAKGGADFTSDDSPKIYKTDKEGKPLPDDKQPDGFPKTFNPGDKLGDDEKAFIDPSLKVKPLSREPEMDKVTAGVRGKVVDVNEKDGTVGVQVDESGNKLILSGFDPQGVKPGDFIEPETELGNWRRTQGTYRLIIRAVNSRGQFIKAAPVVNFARKPITDKGSLRRDTPEVDPPTTDPKGQAKLPAEGGKAEPEYKVVMDDTAGGKGDRKTFGYDETMKKEKALEAKEVVAKRELEREKAKADEKKDEAGLLKAKIKTVDGELGDAKAKVAAYDREGSALLKQAKDLADRKKDLDEERDELKKNKADLEEEAAAAKTSKDNKKIDAFNKKVERHNAKDDKLQQKYKEWAKKKQSLNTEITAAQKDREKAKKQMDDLDKEKTQLQSKLTGAQGVADAAESNAKKAEGLLKTVADERQKLQEKLKELQGKKDPDGKN
jgi:acetolactate synthase small subunit